MQFYGRDSELKSLRDFTRKETADLIVIRGRRRIGKTTLIEQYGREFNGFINITGLPPESQVSQDIQRRHFAAELESQCDYLNLRWDRWEPLLESLAKYIANTEGPFLVLLDEINWLGRNDPDFLGQLKTAWDRWFKKKPGLTMILSGSMSRWIEDNILDSTGFFGRASFDLYLDELNLNDCRRFWPRFTDDYEIFKFLSVVGGVPRYLELLDPRHSAEQNIERLCFTKGAPLAHEFDRIFSDIFSKRAPIYKRIVESLVNGSLSQQEILDAIAVSKGGTYGDYLLDLQKAGFIACDNSWYLKSGRVSRLRKYRLRDNYLRFYLRYILPRKTIIASGRGKLPSGISGILGLAFENLVLNHRDQVIKVLNISPTDIEVDGAYFQTATKARKGVQVDYLIQCRYQSLYLGEIKFSKEPVSMKVISEVEAKLKALALPKGFSVRPFLVHVNGVKDEVIESDFFAQIISFSELLDSG